MVTIKDVAKHAGVSASCVSKYLKDENSVRPQNRRQIKEAIACLNYVPSRAARSLRYGKTMAVKAIMPPISLPFFAEFFEFLRIHFAISGYSLALHTLSSSDPPMTAEDFADYDGVVVVFPDDSTIVTHLHEILSALGRPLVVVSGTHYGDGIHTIHVNMEQGITDVCRFLMDNGRQRISFVGGTDKSASSDIRFAGYANTVPPEMQCGVYRGGFSMNWGYRAAQLMVKRSPLPDAVICENDSLAAAIIKYMVTHGISVPEDMWVIGFDNISMAEMYNPSISSVGMPSRDIAITVAIALIAEMNGETPEYKQFDCNFVLRESTGHDS
ncbi:MAG: LacI family transcriptional regulator [Ruminococcaceae bacterium]|nr:LacI family transcriptional regulator [Oscillospiraceae bacterium]